MRLLDSQIYKGILNITAKILRDYFFYDGDALSKFIDLFTEKMRTEYLRLEKTAPHSMICFLKHDPRGRKYFTSYFVSYHLHDVLVDDFHFENEELMMFDNILPKFVGVQDAYAEQRHKRAHY